MSGLLGALTLPTIPVPGLNGIIPAIPSLSSLAGLPPLPSLSSFTNSPASLISGIADITSDILNGGSPQAAGQWGLFDSGGNLVLTADTVLGVELKKESNVSTYPVEGGGFATYNKVQMPFDARIRFAIGQTSTARTFFLNQVDAAYKSLNLYSVATPEFTYQSATIDHYDYRRETRNGAAMLVVDIWLLEVRVVQPATQSTMTNDDGTSSDAAQHLPGSQVSSPASADPVNNGTLTPQVPSALQAAASSILPSSYPLGFTQGSVTGFIYNAAGMVQRDATAAIGTALAPLKQVAGI